MKLSIVLAGLAVATTSASADTWTKMQARVVRADFPFPTDFYADRAIAIHDTNGNCQIDTAVAGDAQQQFPFALGPFGSITAGRHIGSPYALVPGFENGEITINGIPGICGRTMVYGEMVQNGTTYFLWFALPETGAVPGGYDANWPLDYGIGSFDGSDALHSSVVHHATGVKDFRANNGTTDSVFPAVVSWSPGTPGTVANPGHVFSADADVTRPWPASWGLFSAGTLAGDYTQAFFMGFDNVIVDVPLVAEESWDGSTAFASVSKQIGRSISPLNGGIGMVTASHTVHLPTTHEIVADFNGDGRSDVALWNPGWASVPIYTSTGTGFSITNAATPAGMNWINDGASNKLVGDFSGDGRADIALWKPGWQSIPMYRSNGGGNFIVTNFADPSGANLINQANAPAKLVGDFDGDGKDDIALMRSDWNSVPVYFSIGTGAFRWTNFLTPANQNWINWAGVRRFVGDFTGDGRADILVTSAGWSATALYVSNGNGSFTCLVGTSGAGNWMNNMAANPLVADFDGDGRTDVAFWKPGWNSTPVYLSNGNGTFRITNFLTSSAEINDASATRSLGDFDGDGRTDIAVTRAGYTGIALYTSSGAGWFTRTVRTPSNNTNVWLNRAETQVLVGDFNGDGKADLISRSLGYVSTPIYTSLGNGFTGALAFHPSGQNWINQ